MKARVIRRGGEVVIVIPEDVATSKLQNVSEVDVEFHGSDVVVSPHSMTLDEMLDQITDDNRHELIDFGPPVGKEIW